jgi:hypothetical protein
MQVVLAYQTFSSFAGSETYLLTMAEYLERLGHEVVVYTLEPGEVARVAEARGVRVATALQDLPRECDAVLAQDGATAYQMAERYPQAPRVFVAHSTEFSAQTPPQLPAVCGAIVVMNDRVRRHVERLAHSPEAVRLRQPVDVARFRVGFARTRASRPRAREVAVFGNQLTGTRYEIVVRASEAHGLRVKRIGWFGAASASPEHEIADVDIVVGMGRCAIEGMAAGKPTYVYGVAGGDGWVTSDSYPALEADGFSGQASDAAVDVDSLRADLALWSADMGEPNRDLAYRNHDAAKHAEDLVSLWRRLGASGSPAPEPAHEMARLVRLQSGVESRALALRIENVRLHAELDKANARLNELKATRRYRLASALSAPLDVMRRLGRLVGRLRPSR